MGAAAWRRGLWAETLCGVVLRLKGYRILARRWRSPVGEIDIVACRGETLAVIEVKARRDAGEAAGAVPPHQWRRLARAAALFLSRYPRYTGHAVRFDLMAVTPWAWPRHTPDAWRP